MLKELKARLLGIVRNEDGAALVVTLAVFFFMYLLIAGVYAVGMSVKNRIHLQNACDAAAYSAAVVQADTLSRIATINRAMSWTYVQMTRRQMDYIVYTWLKHTKKHYDIDAAVAKAWALEGSPCEAHVLDWDISDITINGSQLLPDNFDGTLNQFANGLGGASFYDAQGSGINKLKSQIVADKTTVSKMNDAVRNLAEGIKDAVDDAVEDVLRANVPTYDHDRCRYLVQQSKNPLDDYFEGLKNTEEDESRFLAFSKNGSPEETFEGGTDVWFVRGNERKNDGEDGIRRSYNHAERGKLYSEWSWHSTKWVCGHRLTSWWHIPSPLTTCPHSHLNDMCTMIGSLKPKYIWYQVQQRVPLRIGKKTIWRTRWVWKVAVTYVPADGTTVTMKAKCYGDNSEIYDTKYYVGEIADPLILKDSYFGKAGTITVGLAMKNENPWLSLLGADGVAQGIYSAFNPFHECEWSWAFASAKAGYKRLGETWESETIDEAEVMSRKYRIDWEEGDWSAPEQSWNLCQSDWDAVLIPVRCAESQATSDAWTIGNTEHLATYVGGNWQDLGAAGADVGTWSKMIAGGTKRPADAEKYAQRFDQLHAVTTDFDDSGKVTAEWQIGGRGTPLEWEKLANRMRH